MKSDTWAGMTLDPSKSGFQLPAWETARPTARPRSASRLWFTPVCRSQRQWGRSRSVPPAGAERGWGRRLPAARQTEEQARTPVPPVLTWYLWNSDLFAAAAITPVAERLYLYDVVLVKREGELHGGFICFYYGRAALPVPPVQNLQQRGERRGGRNGRHAHCPNGSQICCCSFPASDAQTHGLVTERPLNPPQGSVLGTHTSTTVTEPRRRADTGRGVMTMGSTTWGLGTWQSPSAKSLAWSS